MRNQEIAHTIYIQLGGNGFSMMIGMKSPILYTSNEERGEITAVFQWRARAYDGLNILQVTLVEALDTYRVVFGRKTSQGVVWQEPHFDVYAEDLNPLFEKTTGLRTIPPVVIMTGG